ncbi:hypothetical protein [Acinetobacter sp. YH12086]|uniref:hypothetical protein n=1 Tax=Acinetobacter sp. YH12086 TaxID=2601078 RepID=UPI0015D3F1A4|nr:hypothetical protein [Acinetobacter sp. YH12086]
MEIKTRQHHFKKHQGKLDANLIHKILANHLAKQVGLDVGDADVSYSVHISVSELTGLSEARVEVTQTLIDAEKVEFDEDG